jgi:hypothetical protein
VLVDVVVLVVEALAVLLEALLLALPLVGVLNRLSAVASEPEPEVAVPLVDEVVAAVEVDELDEVVAALLVLPLLLLLLPPPPPGPRRLPRICGASREA